MPPPSPRPTLFPYTTLFRSSMLLPGPHRPLPSLLRHLAVPPPARRSGRSRPPLHGQARGPSGGLGGGRDRKSTRLNSSHTVISYAVFCLKKKNKQQLRKKQR